MEDLNPMDKEASLVFERSSAYNCKGLRQEPVTLVKSNSVSAAKADILKLDMTSPQNWSELGYRLSTGDSPLNVKRYGSQGPAALRTFPSTGTPSRSSFSGVPTFMISHRANYNMVAKTATVNEVNGKILPLYHLPCSDQDVITAGRLSVGSRAAPPSKWDNAEKWLVNSSPSHPQYCSSPSQLPPNPSKLLAATNHGFIESKKNPINHKRVNVVSVAAPLPLPQLGARTHANTDTNTSMQYQSRALVPLPSSSSCESHLHQDELAATVSDSEVSSTQEEYRVFVRSSSHKPKLESDAKHRNKNLARKMVSNKDELHISSPATLQLERLKSSGMNPHEQLPKMHDVYADRVVETLRQGGCRPAAGRGGGGCTRVVVQACKVSIKGGGAAPMRDASTDVSPAKASTTLMRRDIGTQITPAASSKTSRSATPLKSNSPVRHNTPARKSASNCTKNDANHGPNLLELESFHLAKLEHRDLTHQISDSSTGLSTATLVITSNSWKSPQDAASDDKETSNFIKPVEMKMPETSATAAWEEAEKSKHMAKCAREESRIDAWENHQRARAEAEMKKLEMKLDRLRAQGTEKIKNKLAAAHLRAEEMRAAARAQQAEQLAKALERASSIRKGGGYFPESLGRVCFAILP